VYLVPGNHERSRISTTLFELHPNIHIFDRPRTYKLRIRGRTVTLSGFPSCRNGIRDNFAGLVCRTSIGNHKADLRLLCVHQSVEGAQVGVHNYTFRNGPDVIPGELLPSDIDAVLAGHIHRCQCLTHDMRGEPFPAPVLYPGSIERTSFAERLEPKGFFLLEFAFPDSAPRPVLSHTFHPLPCRPMIDLPLDAAKLNGPGGETVLGELLSTLDPDGIVRFSVRGELSPRGASILSAERLRRLPPPTMNVAINWGSIR
jgi:DNA repair exonuclease SbcCD nuclease subunit